MSAAKGKPLPLTKALHTTRVVGRVAALLWDLRGRAAFPTTGDLFYAVLDVLGNEPPTDRELRAACISACVMAVRE